MASDKMGMADPAQLVLWLGVSCPVVFLLCITTRIRRLARRAPQAAETRGLLRAKLGIGPALAVFLVIYLVWTYRRSEPAAHGTDGTLAVSLALSAVAAACLGPLRHLERRRSRSASSDLATLYLAASVLCDVVLLTAPCRDVTPWHDLRTALLVRCVVHSALLLLECFDGLSADERAKSRLSDDEARNVVGRVFFWWINPILAYGYRHILRLEGLPYIGQDLKPSRTRRAMLEAWGRRAKPETKMALPLALYQCLRRPFLAAIGLRLCLVVFRYAQPILIRRAIRYVTTPASGDWGSTGYWLIVASLVVYIGLAISTATYEHSMDRLKLSTKSALIGLIHDHMMSLPSAESGDGEAITLMSTDAEGLEGVAEMFHETWAQMLEVVVGMVLLAREVGWLWLLLIFLIFLCSRVSRYVARNLQPRQKVWNAATQTRMAATADMLTSAKLVKMLGLQTVLAERIQWLREQELAVAAGVRWISVYANAAANALGIFSPAVVVAIFAAWLSFVPGGARLDAETAFTTLAVLSRVTHPANMVMTIVPRAFGAFAGFDRIQRYLTKPRLPDYRSVNTGTASPQAARGLSGSGTSPPAGPEEQHEALSLGDTPPRDDQTVTTLFPAPQDAGVVEILPGSFVVVSGPVGSGKSTLLRVLLGELPPSTTAVAIASRRIAYCAQRPWLPGGSIREAITGSASGYDEQWYREVVGACCLVHDLDALPEGDDTRAGSRGDNLSGGQRQRVALARAVFSRCDAVLLDDTFSALDGETENRAFEELLGPHGLLRKAGTTVVLVSNDAKYQEAADSVVVLGSDGRVLEQGPWQTIQAKSSVVAKFTPRDKSGGPASSPPITKDPGGLAARLAAMDGAEMDLARRTGDTALYRYFCEFAGFRNVALVASSIATYALFGALPQYLIKIWTESAEDSAALSLFITGLLLLAFVAWAATSATRWAAVILLAPQAGLSLHRHLLAIVTRAPLSFFSTVDVGSILNRFGQDIQLIDKQLPTAVIDICAQVSKLVVNSALLFIVQGRLLVTLPAVTVVVYIVQRAYLRTSRQLRFLELEAKAAVFSSFLESLDGLETLRAFGWSGRAIEANEEAVEGAQRPEFLLLALQRWLNLVLDLVAAAVATAVVVISVARRDSVSGGQVGVALNVMLIASQTLLRLVQAWTNLETSLGAVARLKTLEEQTPSEEKPAAPLSPAMMPAQDLCLQGGITMTDVTASYRPGAPVLRNISLRIEPGQKVLVRGRTGSGKSSLLLALLRMLSLDSGRIELDGSSIDGIPPSELRQRCFVVVSQDPLLLRNEDLRFNLEPGDAAVSDAALTRALERVGLWDTLRGNGDREGLYSDLDSSADTTSSILERRLSDFPALSAGQRQLFALARAVVKAGALRAAGLRPIVLLDEATSSVDADTERRILDVVEAEFSGHGHTVVVVTHRSGAVARYMRPGRDLVVDMADGVARGVVRVVSGIESDILEQEET